MSLKPGRRRAAHRPRQDHQLLRLHVIDAPALDRTFWWRGKQLRGGTMALAALDVLAAGVKVGCEVVERDRHGRIVAKVFAPKRSGRTR